MQKDVHENLLVVKICELPRLVDLVLADGTREHYNLRPRADQRGMYLNKVERQGGRRLRKSDRPR
jgi:hypothetical protein